MVGVALVCSVVFSCLVSVHFAVSRKKNTLHMVISLAEIFSILLSAEGMAPKVGLRGASNFLKSPFGNMNASRRFTGAVFRHFRQSVVTWAQGVAGSRETQLHHTLLHTVPRPGCLKLRNTRRRRTTWTRSCFRTGS